MPAGVAWSTYLKALTASLLSMLAGAQVVHMYYRPLEDMSELVEHEKEKLKRTREMVENSEKNALEGDPEKKNDRTEERQKNEET